MNPLPDSHSGLAARDLAVLWHPCTQMKDHERDMPLIPIARGEGAWLVGTDGRRYLDAISSWWVNLFGHANPVISTAVAELLGQLAHVIYSGFSHVPAAEPAEARLRVAYPGLSRCLIVCLGEEALDRYS